MIMPMRSLLALQEETLKPALEEQRRIMAKHGNKLDLDVLAEMEVRAAAPLLMVTCSRPVLSPGHAHGTC